MANKGKQTRTILSVLGRVKVVRQWWHAPRIGSVAPVDEVIDSSGATVTLGVREMACRLNDGSTSFDKTAANLLRAALIRMSGEQLRKVVLVQGQAVLEAQKANTVPPSFRAAECVVDKTLPLVDQTSRVYVGVDGVMVPVVTEAEKVKRRKAVRQKRSRSGKRARPLLPRVKGSDQSFKEFKAIVFYDESKQRWHTLLSRSVRRQVGALVRREASRLGLRHASEKVALVDGASWIRTQLTERPDLLPLDGLGLDFYHLAENVHRCRRAVYGDEDQAGRDWAAALLHTLRHETYESAWDELTAWRQTLRSPGKKQAADRLLAYVSERQEMIRYKAFDEKGWQIGSGPTESRCKTMTSRLKGRGRRWNIANAERVAALTTLLESGQWSLYWPTPVTTKT
jgi:hypothetical protein